MNQEVWILEARLKQLEIRLKQLNELHNKTIEDLQKLTKDV
jgi:hypothetical protein